METIDPMPPERPQTLIAPQLAPRCTARIKLRPGETCTQPAMPNGKCRLHGGKSLSGAAHPGLTKGGKYSKYLPAALAERYEVALHDADLIALRDEIAVTDSRITSLLERADTKESGELYKRIKDTIRQMRSATENDLSPVWSGLSYLQKLAEEGLTDYYLWTEIGTTLETRRRLVETERKRLEALNQTMTATEAANFAQALLGIIKSRVTDRLVLQAVQNDIIELMSKKERESA